MSKLCQNCGSPIAEGALFCFTCGTRVPVTHVPQPPATPAEPIVQAEPVVPAEPAVAFESEIPVAEDIPSVEQPEVAVPTEEKPKKGKGAKRVIKLIVLVLVLLGILTCVGIGAFTYISDRSDINDVISNYVDAVYLGEFDKAEDMLPQVVLEENTEDIEEFKSYYDAEEVANDRSVAMDEEFGANIKISCEVVEFDRICGDAMLVYNDIIDMGGLTDDVEIDKMYRVVYDVTVKGDDGEATYTHNRLALEIDGEWYLFDFSSQYFAFFDVYMSFLEIDELYIEYDGDAVYY